MARARARFSKELDPQTGTTFASKHLPLAQTREVTAVLKCLKI